MSNAKIFLMLFLTVTSFLFSQNKTVLFSDAEKLSGKLNDLNAQLYSPVNYSRGTALLEKAKKLYESGASDEEVFAVLQDAESYFYKALERTKINKDLFAYVSSLRNRAYEKAGDSNAAQQFLQAGEKDFTEGILLSESEADIDSVKKKINASVKNFNTAIIIAEKEKIFAPTVEIRKAAIDADAELFAPAEFNKGEKFFKNAIEFASLNNGEDFIKSIYSAEQFFKTAYSNAVLIKSNNASLTTAIDYARKANASEFAPEKWNEAKKLLARASEEFQNKEYEDYQKDITLATKLFWDAEETALYNKNIGLFKQKLNALKKEDAEKYAATLVRKIELLLAKSESAFSKNRYDKELESLSRKIERELSRLEKITEIYNTKKADYIDSLIVNEIYPFGNSEKASVNSPNKPEEVKDANIAQTEISLPVPQNVTEEKKTVPKKKEEKKSATIVKETPVKETPKKAVKQPQTPLEKTLNYFNKVFDEKEGIVVSKSENSFRVRLTGLKLKAYQKYLTPQQKNLLMKLHNVIQFSGKIKKVIIEVYSDSKGGDRLNKKLSQSRANIVKNTLVSYGVPRKIIVAKGIGNKNPIASNATFEGRNKNRRIEVIFVF